MGSNRRSYRQTDNKVGNDNPWVILFIVTGNGYFQSLTRWLQDCRARGGTSSFSSHSPRGAAPGRFVLMRPEESGSHLVKPSQPHVGAVAGGPTRGQRSEEIWVSPAFNRPPRSTHNTGVLASLQPCVCYDWHNCSWDLIFLGGSESGGGGWGSKAWFIWNMNAGIWKRKKKLFLFSTLLKIFKFLALHTPAHRTRSARAKHWT